MSTSPAPQQERLAASSAPRSTSRPMWQPHSLSHLLTVPVRRAYPPPGGASRRHSRQDRTGTPAAPLSRALPSPQLFAMRACVVTPTSMAGCPAVESFETSTSSTDGEPSRALRPRENACCKNCAYRFDFIAFRIFRTPLAALKRLQGDSPGGPAARAIAAKPGLIRRRSPADSRLARDPRR